MTNIDGISLLVGLFLGVAIGMAFLAVCMAWDRPAPAPADVDMRDFEANVRARWRS